MIESHRNLQIYGPQLKSQDQDTSIFRALRRIRG